MMKYRNVAVWLVVSVFTVFWTSCGPRHDGHDDHQQEEEHTSGHEHAHEEEIVLSPESAARFGVEVDTVSPAVFTEVVKVTGSLSLNPQNVANAVARSSGILHYVDGVVPGMKVSAGQTIAYVSAEGIAGGDPNAVSAAEFDAARRELDRIQPLYDAGVVSLKELNAAKATYDRALNASSGSRKGSEIQIVKNGVITQLLATQGAYVEQGQPVAQVSSGDDMVLRADLPQKYSLLASRFNDANFRVAASDSIFTLTEFDGRRIGAPAFSSSDMPGYTPVYFSLNGGGRLMSDSYAEVYLKGASRGNVISVPRSAVSEEQGQHFVYVRVDEHGYKKIPVSMGQSDGIRVEILNGLSDGDIVVTKGVVFVKLAQTSNVVPSGHSHNH